jgi:hypothetical protein
MTDAAPAGPHSRRRTRSESDPPHAARTSSPSSRLSISARNSATVVAMCRWGTVLLAALAMSSAPLPVIAQTRGSSGLRPHGPTTRPPRPGPSQPPAGPTVTAPPFRTTLIVPPAPAGPHRVVPFRSSWFGLVLLDPNWWAPDSVDQPFLSPALPPSDSGPTGGLQLDVEPRRALVYVDGWFVGVVDQFSGYYHHLDLPARSYRIELVAPDYDPLTVAVMVTPGRTTTYRGALNRR